MVLPHSTLCVCIPPPNTPYPCSPVNVLVKPEDLAETLNPRQCRLYRLIWCRAVASLMNPAQDTHVSLSIGPSDSSLQLAARGQWNTFAGFLAAYAQPSTANGGVEEPTAPLEEGSMEAEEGMSSGTGASTALAKRLAAMQVGDPLRVVGLEVARIDPPPPGRYTEAGLVAAMTKLGIGRPSTYATVLAVLQVC